MPTIKDHIKIKSIIGQAVITNKISPGVASCSVESIAKWYKTAKTKPQRR
jgi:hypothetical protein